MTQQEIFNKFIKERCCKCKMKKDNKCNIVINKNNIAKCTEEK